MKIDNGFNLLSIFAEKLHRRCLTGLKTGFWLLAKGLKYRVHPFSQPNN